DVIADSAMQSLGLYSFRRRLAQLFRISQVRLENLPQHFTGPPIYVGDARIVINVLVQEFSQIAIRLEQIIAVTNQVRWLLARFVSTFDTPICNGFCTGRDHIAYFRVDNISND